jgi:D-proline reductase (dithiol) PrdB
MVRLSDVSPEEAEFLRETECPTFDEQPWVTGPPLSARRVAMVSSAGLNMRGERPFLSGNPGYRAIPADAPAGDILMSHVSVSYDRTGFQQDLNVVLPIDRLRELAAEGVIGAAADTHYSFMGAVAPEAMEPQARKLSQSLKDDGVDSLILLPV